MLTPVLGVVTFGFIVVVGVTTGVLFLVNAPRIHAWSAGHALPGWIRKPSLLEVRLLGGFWTLLGLFSIGGVVHWATRL